MWLMVSSLSPHNLHLLFCCILSILALIWLVLIALFCVAIRRDSISLLRFPFLSHYYYYYHYFVLLFANFFTPVLTGDFHWSLSDSKSPGFRTILSILTDSNNAVLQFTQSIFLAFGHCSKSSNYDWYHCHVLQHFQSSSLIQVFVSLFFFFHSMECWNDKNLLVNKFFYVNPRSGLLFGIAWSICISNSENLLLLFNSFEFFTPVLADGSLLESEWQQVSRTLLSILTNLNNAVVWIISTCPLISKSSSPCTECINYNWYHRHFMFHRFFQFSHKV